MRRCFVFDSKENTLNIIECIVTTLCCILCALPSYESMLWCSISLPIEKSRLFFIGLFGQCYIVWKRLILILPFHGGEPFCHEYQLSSLIVYSFIKKKNCSFSLNNIMELWFFDGPVPQFHSMNVAHWIAKCPKITTGHEYIVVDELIENV